MLHGLRMTMMCALAVGGVKPCPVSAQGETEDITIMGQVLDDSGHPVPLAIVGLIRSDRGVMTDSAGRFTLPVPPQPVYRIGAEQLGYRNGQVTVESAELERPVTILIYRDPVLLEGLKVTVDRFEQRRRFYTGSIRVLDQTRLARSPAANGRELIRRNVNGATRTCFDDSGDDCVLRRGQLQRMRVCVDERPAWGGSGELEHYQPEELYMVEIYDRGLGVRVYTRWFVEQMAGRPRALVPIQFGC